MSKELSEIFAGKSVSLLGAGISNMPLAKIASEHALKLTVRDKKSPAELGANAETLISLGAELITGDDYLTDITEDIVFRSPGIRPDIDGLVEAKKNGSVLTSEMEMFLANRPCPVYAITGSDGKTTTTTITSLLLRAGSDGEVFLGGNIGDPLLHRLPLMKESDCAAVELSSFQLMTVDAYIDVAAITNITPNHLNWHTDMDEYIAAKKNILKNVGRAVLNYDNAITREIAFEMQKTPVPVTFFSLAPLPDGLLRDIDSAVWLEDGVICSCFPEDGNCKIMNRSDIRLPGMHNTANFITAVAVTYGKVSAEAIRETARTFGGVEHRLEFVGEKDGVAYINGSIDSSPTRTAAALSALEGRSIVLIAGGCDKNIPYAPLADAVYSSGVHTIVLTGETAPKIKAALTEHELYGKRELAIIENSDFDAAVYSARDAAKEGDTVLLSPASTSFDRFKNFEERGRHFKELVHKILMGT